MVPDDFIFQYTTNAMDAVINLQLTVCGDAMAILAFVIIRKVLVRDFNNPRIVKVWRGSLLKGIGTIERMDGS